MDIYFFIRVYILLTCLIFLRYYYIVRIVSFKLYFHEGRMETDYRVFLVIFLVLIIY